MKSDSSKLPPLWLCILLDVVGLLSYVLPALGEWMDIAWAPISAFLFSRLFGGIKGTILVFLEEILPFTDVIPIFTITYFIRKNKAI